MGKSKKRSRVSRNRLNPLNKDGNKTDLSKKDASLVARKIEPLIKQLQSAVPNDRNIALSSISVLCEDPHMRHLLLKEKLIQIILNNLLNDNNMDIVIEAVGLLRNLTLEEGYDLAIHLWRNQIWTAIKDGLNKIVQSLDLMVKSKMESGSERERKDISKHTKRLLFDYSDNLISLIVALSNGADQILNEILQDDQLHEILYTFVKFIEYGFNKLPCHLQNTLLDFIYDFSSESLDFIDSVMAFEPIAILLSSLDKLEINNELTQILIQGIKLQFLDGVIDEQITSTNCNEIVIKVISSIKHINLDQMKKGLYSDVVLSNNDNGNSDGTIDSNLVTANTQKLKEYTKAKQESMMQLQAIEVGIDVITGIIEIIASSDIKLNQELTQSIHELIPQFLFVLLKEFPDRVLIAWNNLLWLYVTLDEPIESDILKQLWNEITNQTDTLTQEDMIIKIGKMSVIWVILKLCGILGYIDLLQEWLIWNNLGFVSKIKEEYLLNDDIEYRTKCCGIMITIASYQGQSIEINKFVSEFLLEKMVSLETPPELLIDMIYAMFEIYGDRDYDYDEIVFVQGGYLDILREKVQPHLRNVFKMVDKNKTPELKERCTKCYNTLDSFLHYKANERR
ncbi:Syo1p PWA37_003216 [Arxiozyma heterogenica]|uniref:SYO1-like TPR repeats domain-containing protein n=1 Tax=Arxiozyma heterogenica TaxID=278026 RepID=A0AAN7WRG9_9SACH|nr:hypothetical protein RI543_001699 [Kazachstania heterogenica]